MMELKVTVVLPGLPEAINNLANALMNQAQTIKMTAQQTVIPAAPNSEPVQPVPTPVAEPAVEAVPAPVVEPTVEAAPAPAVEEVAAIPSTPAVDPAPTKKYTREEIANAGSALVTQGKMNDLLALLQKYGVQSITQLDPNQYNVFAADLKALGAAL